MLALVLMLNTFVSDYRDYLLRELSARMERRPHYSKRAFARDLALSPSTITGFLKGEIRFSPARAKSIGKQIKLNLEQIEHWQDLMDQQFCRDGGKKVLAELKVKSRLQAQSHSISIDRFKYISEWHHAAFLELIQMDAKKFSNVNTAAKSLGVSPKTLNLAIKRLTLLGLLTKSGDILEVVKNIQVGDQIPSLAIRQFHSDILQKSIRALEVQDFNQRFNSSLVFRVPKKRIPEIKEDLKQISRQVVDKVFAQGNNESDDVYCLGIQLFSLLK